MPDKNVIGIVDCPTLKMYADFLSRRGYTVVFFMDAPPATDCSILLFCSDHLNHPTIQSAGFTFSCPKILLNAEPPVGWKNVHRLNAPILPLELESKIASLRDDITKAHDSFHILAIEDDATTAMTLVRTFQEGGFSIKICRGYAELMSSLHPVPDLIVMDLNLPGITGDKLGEMIRKQNIPVVVFSSQPPDRLEEVRKRIGGVAAFQKGIPQRTMREWIRNYLQQKKA